MPSYVSHYDDKSFLKYNEVPKPDDILARSQALRAYGLHIIVEAWVKGQGYSPVFTGPSLTEEEQSLLCVKIIY